MSTELPTWAVVVPQSAENKEELLRQFVRQLRGLCSVEGVELPHPFVYIWEDITQETLSGLADFVDSLLSATFDFVLCICNSCFDHDQLPHVPEDMPSIEHSFLYLTFEKIEKNSFSVVEEALLSLSSCFALRASKASESMAPSTHQTVPGSALRTFMDSGYGCANEGDRYTGALNVCSCCKPNAYQERFLDYNRHWWWDLILTVSTVPTGLMRRALAERIANVAPPSQLKDLYNNDSGSRLTESWSKVASSIGTIPMPSELPEKILLHVVRSYSSRYPSLQWAEEFASISPQWKHVVETHRRQLPRLAVDAVKLSGCQLEILLQPNDPQPPTGVRPQTVILKDEAANTAATLCRIAARSLIISLEDDKTLEKVLFHLRYGGLRAMSITLEPPERLVDANVTQIMRAIGAADRLRAEVKRTRDIEILIAYFPSFIRTFEIDPGSCCVLDDDSSLDLLLYFANRMTLRDIVIERYHTDILEHADKMAKKFSCGSASRLNILVVPACKITSKQKVQTTITLNIRRPDGRRFVAVREGSGMRLIIGDDRAVNELMSGREDYDSLLPLLNRGSSEFEQLKKAVYETLFSQPVGYNDLHQFQQDIRNDYNIDGEQEARRFTYKSFPDFLRSAEMNAKVNVTENSSGTTVYEAIPNAENIHLRWEQQKSVVSVVERSAKKARNEASDARRKASELERRLPGLERRIQELELQVRQRDETIRQNSAALAEAENKIECFCCKDKPIEVVFNCGHGACRACTEQLTTEERTAPGTNRFSTNGRKVRVRKVDPKCSQCGESVDPCVQFYPFRA